MSANRLKIYETIAKVRNEETAININCVMSVSISVFKYSHFDD